jgi:hypothetical protein
VVAKIARREPKNSRLNPGPCREVQRIEPDGRVGRVPFSSTGSERLDLKTAAACTQRVPEIPVALESKPECGVHQRQRFEPDGGGQDQLETEVPQNLERAGRRRGVRSGAIGALAGTA